MPRDISAEQDSATKSPVENQQSSDQIKKDESSKDDDFETIDASEEEPHAGAEEQTPGTSHDELRLQRVTNSYDDTEDLPDEDEDDDSDEDEHIMHSHPIFGMLAGRLGQRRRGSTHKYDSLHPENQVLTIANVDDCVEVEKAFPEHERCSKEKFEYRLSRCPELSLGLFTQPTKAEVDSGVPDKRKLIAHIVATRTAAPCVTDASMDYPSDWRTNKTTLPISGEKEVSGHQDVGGTVCIHSLAVSPEYQNMGLGTVLLKSYIQRIKDSKIADRLALLAHDDLKKYYARFGFDDLGLSNCKFGGGGWNNMVLEFSDLQDE